MFREWRELRHRLGAGKNTGPYGQQGNVACSLLEVLAELSVRSHSKKDQHLIVYYVLGNPLKHFMCMNLTESF